MTNPKFEINVTLNNETDIELITHDHGVTMYVYIDGNTAYEINLLKEKTRLQVKEYDGKSHFDESLEDLWREWEGF